MPQARYRGPPMTLANMRENGVRSLSVTCDLCHHEAVMNVDAFSDAVPVPAFGPCMICTSCGMIGADVRPDWGPHVNKRRVWVVSQFDCGG